MQTIDEAREHCRFVGKGISNLSAESIAQCQETITCLNAMAGESA